MIFFADDWKFPITEDVMMVNGEQRKVFVLLCEYQGERIYGITSTTSPMAESIRLAMEIAVFEGSDPIAAMTGHSTEQVLELRRER